MDYKIIILTFDLMQESTFEKDCNIHISWSCTNIYKFYLSTCKQL